MISKTEHRITELLAEIPNEFLVSFVIELPRIYHLAYTQTYRDHRKEEAKDLLPYMRRSYVEELFHSSADRFQSLLVFDESNEVNNCNHVTVRSGSIVLTVSAVNSPCEMVRPAHYRQTLALSNQTLLFPDMYDISHRDSFYGVILHGPEYQNQERLSFVCLGFPSADGKRYIHHIDLVRHFNLQLYSPALEEEISDTAIARIRQAGQISESSS